MAQVIFPDQLLVHTGGEREIEIECRTFRQLVQLLEQRWPGIEPILKNTAVAIDGHIYQDAWFEEIQPNSEVFFMQRLEGG